MSRNEPRYELVDDWKYIHDFGIDIITESKRHKITEVIGQRIMILHLDHANELLMKSFLLRKNFVIEMLKEKDIKKGIKTWDVRKKSKTIDYSDALNLVCDNIQFSNDKKEKIIEFHKIRNELQHRAINLPLDKGGKIKEVYPYLKELYEKMFPESVNCFPRFESLTENQV